MKKLTKRLACLAIAAVLLAGVGAGALMLSAAGAGASEYSYQYILVPKRKPSGMGYYDGASSDGQVKLDLYVVSQKPDGSATAEAPALQTGNFGLRLPAWVPEQIDDGAGNMVANISFEADSGVTLQQSMKTKPTARYDYSTTPANMTAKSVYRYVAPNEADNTPGERYHFFTWQGAMEGNQVNLSWTEQADVGGCYGMKLGTYSFTLPFKNGTDNTNGYRLPIQGDVDLLNWLIAQESIPVERGETTGADGTSNGLDGYNRTIWNPDTKLYQGYYNSGLNTDDLLTQTDIGFQFRIPSSWASITPVFSYDPKKEVTGKLINITTGKVVATLDPDSIADAIWNSTDKDVPSWCYPEIGAANGGTGIGPYYTGIRLDNPGLYFQSDGGGITAGTTYRLELSKPGSLTANIEITAAVNNSLEGAEGLPASGGFYRLLAGDLNSDGRIDMADRSILLGRLGQKVAEGAYDDMTLDDKQVYAADLDGDGYVTMADLSILMSPENYLHESN